MERFDPEQARHDADVRATNIIVRSLILAKGETMLAQNLARPSRALQGYSADVFERVTMPHTKANVAGTADAATVAPTAVLMRRALRESVLGQLPNVVKIPFRSSGKSLLVAGAAGFVAEGFSIPVHAATFAALRHDLRTVIALAVYTQEAARDVADTDTAFSDELTTLLSIAINARFSGSAAASASAPAGVANGAGTVASSGATVAAMSVDFAAAIKVIANAGYVPDCWLLSPSAAAYVRLMKVADASGETLAGLPILSGTGVTGVTLLASNRIALSVADRVAVTASQEADLNMVDNPANDIITPTASAHMVSLFQTNSVAVRASLAINYTVAAASTNVVSVTGAAYA